MTRDSDPELLRKADSLPIGINLTVQAHCAECGSSMSMRERVRTGESADGKLRDFKITLAVRGWVRVEKVTQYRNASGVERLAWSEPIYLLDNVLRGRGVEHLAEPTIRKFQAIATHPVLLCPSCFGRLT